RHEMAALDQVYKFRLDLARNHFADAPVLLDIGPLTDQIEMVGIRGIATQHAVLDLRARAVERVVVAVVEFIEQLDKLVPSTGLDPKIIDMKVISLGG